MWMRRTASLASRSARFARDLEHPVVAARGQLHALGGLGRLFLYVPDMKNYPESNRYIPFVLVNGDRQRVYFSLFKKPF